MAYVREYYLKDGDELVDADHREGSCGHEHTRKAPRGAFARVAHRLVSALAS
jgi:hypothetical protein